MATEQYPPQPAPVADRRAPERRSYTRREEDRTQLTRTAAAAVMAICGGLALIFVFFWALGAVDIKNAVLSTVIACLLGGIWLAGFVYRHRTRAEQVVRHERERRGF